MKTNVLLLALSLGANLVWAEAAKPAAKRPKPKVIDLDFSDDEVPPPAALPAAPAPVPARSARVHSDSHPWVYWAMGVSVVAAGGVGWYLHEQQAKEPVVTRTDQVFTDER
jgi:hypothetical protein